MVRSLGRPAGRRALSAAEGGTLQKEGPLTHSLTHSLETQCAAAADHSAPSDCLPTLPTGGGRVEHKYIPLLLLLAVHKSKKLLLCVHSPPGLARAQQHGAMADDDGWTSEHL